MELSLCMIVKNEEAVLDRCLGSIKDAVDEIVIVDTGSTDQTKKIAANYTPLVYEFPWDDDFAKARNFAFSKGTKDYLMWLDADDVIASESGKLIRALIDHMDPAVDMVMMPYHVAFDEQGKTTMMYERERIVRRAAGFQWVGVIHEVIPPSGQVIHADIPILHQKIGPGDPDRNLRIFEKMIAEGKQLSAREEYYYARELMYHQRFFDAVRIFHKFLDEGLGWIENILSAFRDLADCYFAMGDKKQALTSLLESFRYDMPRAETCCQIGKYFLDEENYAVAAFWYELAASGKLKNPPGGFVHPDCYGFIPYLQLCVCYYRMGDISRAMECNRLAGGIKPNDPSVLYNIDFFRSYQLQENGSKIN